MTFEDFNISKTLLQAIDEMGYVNPTPIQKAAYNKVMSGVDVVGVAQTGTGKTIAYLLPLLRMLNFSKQKDPRIMIIVPTRELVFQVMEELEKLTAFSNFKAVGVYGGANINTQKKWVLEKHDILVGTPNRLIDLALCRAYRMTGIKHLVLDEFDVILDLGFKTQINTLFDMLPKKRQNLLFSATYSPAIEHVVSDRFERHHLIEIAAHGTPLEQIEQIGYYAANYHTKINLLEHLLKTDEKLEKVLVFVHNKRTANRLYEHISPIFPDKIGVIHANKSVNTRLGAVELFENKTHRVLIATDVIARGIDITEITHVINFNMPLNPDYYIHRIGRTGRADMPGTAISFMAEGEVPMQETIETLMKKPIDIVSFPDEVEVSDVLLEEEKTIYKQKDYLPQNTLKHSKGAYQERSKKRQKVNEGGPYKKKQQRSGRKKR